MTGNERRSLILQRLSNAAAPLSGLALGQELGVSRQVIVGDVALLRSAGETIMATPRGYLFGREHDGIVHQIAVKHTSDETEAELNAIVDQGCTVKDVIVEHPLYGQLTGSLQLSSRYDVSQFISRCREADAKPLSELTGGIHLHTVSCPDEASFARVLDDLKKLSFLLEDPED